MLQRRMVLSALAALAAAFALISLFLISCDEDPTEIDATTLRITRISGDGQSERVGAMLPEPIVVRITNISGNLRPGISVTFSSTAAGSEALPSTDITDSQGLASCYFVLGTEEGTQQIKAEVTTDSTFFSASAVLPACPEETTESASAWPSGHIFIVTTSSALITTGASVLIDFDPGTDTWEKVLESDLILTDVAFSPRGELYVATPSYIYKVDPTTNDLQQFTPLTEVGHVELEPNSGGILMGISDNGRMFTVKCSPEMAYLYAFSFIPTHTENLATDPLKRDIFFVTGTPPDFQLQKALWDGRSDDGGSVSLITYLNASTGTPRGMCCDSTGTLYITIDGTQNFRRLFEVDPDGTVDTAFFDFVDYFGATEPGRWGDVTILEDELFLIDKDNGRLVVISTDGTFDREVVSNDFFVPGTVLEEYGIAASP
jgi:hypothetical protein